MQVTSVVTYVHNVITPKGKVFDIPDSELSNLVVELEVSKVSVLYKGGMVRLEENHEDTYGNDESKTKLKDVLEKYLVNSL